MVDVELPYRCEYAKSGRAGCKKCKNNIEKDTLRLAKMMPSPFFDGTVPYWFHCDCFFSQCHPTGPEQIGGFENLRFEDQKSIEKNIEQAQPGTSTAAKIGNGKRQKSVEMIVENKEFAVEKAPSNRSTCKLCDNKIEKNLLRIGKLDSESPDALRFGPLYRWFHVDCFVTARDELNFPFAADTLFKFSKLDKADRAMLKKKLPAKKTKNDHGAKQVKKEIVDVEAEAKAKKLIEKEEKQLKKQSDLLFKYIDQLKELSKNELHMIYEANKMHNPPSDSHKLIDRLADAMAFGIPQDCPKCGDSLRFKISRYLCLGHVSEWEKCSYFIEDPKRRKLKIPSDLQEAYTFLKEYKYKSAKRLVNSKLKAGVQKRTYEEVAWAINIKKEKDESEAKKKKTNKSELLKGFLVGAIGKNSYKAEIEKFGGIYSSAVQQNVLFVVAAEESTFTRSQTKQAKAVRSFTVPVVSPMIFTVLNDTGDLVQALLSTYIELWDMSEAKLKERLISLNISDKINNTFKSGSFNYGGGSSSSSSMSMTKSVMKIKSGGVVDPVSDMQDTTHIYREGNTVYNAILNNVDVLKNKNSFYKIQLLEDDLTCTHYWLFKSWGRIGTNIGGHKMEKMTNKQNAISTFKQVYKEQTLNEWDDRHQFKKHPNAYFPVEVDYGQIEPVMDVSSSRSTLPGPIKFLISLIFDVKAMQQAMVEFELDLEKMPLGKLSRAQLLNACSTLKEISTIVESKPIDISKLTAACNKFYSLVPHSFGTTRPPLINSEQQIIDKNLMLESLMDIELACEITKGCDTNEDSIDFHYKKLNATIEVIDSDTEEFRLVQEYMQNTHAATHSTYRLEILHLYRVNRNGEDKRFAKYVDNPNRMLLWHGSRVVNFAGILSQGLRIAPPEAPMNGYMFGKGVYFADSVSKSANYCCTCVSSNTGLLLLSEVALGKSMELANSHYVEKLDKKYLSVKGIGGSHPDPAKVHILPNGVKVPMGQMVPNKSKLARALLYNEYIVYQEEQIKIRYLVCVKFHYANLF